MTDDKRQTAFSLKPFLRLLPIVRRHGATLALAIVTNVLLALVDLCIPLLQSRAVDDFIVRGTLATIAGRASHIRKTALVLIGGFLGDAYEHSRLYDPSFSHSCREAET